MVHKCSVLTNINFQMLMSAPMQHSLVILMPTALTLLAVSCAFASLDTLEMVSLVKVYTVVTMVNICQNTILLSNRHSMLHVDSVFYTYIL